MNKTKPPKDILSQLPDYLVSNLNSWIPSKDFTTRLNWSKASKRFHAFFKEKLKENGIERLISHVVRGEEREAMRMIAQYPEALCAKSSAIDFSGRIFSRVTPFQAALLCHDTVLIKKMEAFFDKVDGGQEEKINQFIELFPEGLPNQQNYKFNNIIQVILNSSQNDIEKALLNEQNDTQICLALNTFRNDFAALSRNELFFNPNHLLRAYRHFEQSNAWLPPQQKLFWCQVIGYIQRFLPACYVQALCQGFPRSRLKRSFKLNPIYEEIANGSMVYLRESSLTAIIDSKNPYYPLLSENHGLGFDFAVSYRVEEIEYGRDYETPERRPVTENERYGQPWDIYEALDAFTALYQNKINELTRLQNGQPINDVTMCVIL